MAFLNDLPTELLIQILSYLNYSDLKFSVAATNHSLGNIVNFLRNHIAPTDQDMGERLFLDTPRSIAIHFCAERSFIRFEHYIPPFDVTPPIFKLHPCIKNLVFSEDVFSSYSNSSLDVSNVGFLQSSSIKFIPLKETTYMMENATSPSSSFLTLNLGGVTTLSRWSVLDSKEQEPENHSHPAITVIKLVEFLLEAVVEHQNIGFQPKRNIDTHNVFNAPIRLKTYWRANKGDGQNGFIKPYLLIGFNKAFL